MINKSYITMIATLSFSFFSLPLCSHAQDLGFGYHKRGEHIHFEGGGKTGTDSTRIDKPSQENIKGFSHGLERDISICKALDVSTFKPLSIEYSRDKNMVYYKWISPGRFLVVELPEADVASFKPINYSHAVDKTSIWYLDRPIPDSEPKTAKLINIQIIKDSKHVYISGRHQPHLDSASFRHAGSAYYIDKSGVYWGGRQIANADPATFKVLGNSFVAVDETNVYRSGERQPHINAKTCKLILHNPYGYQVISDKNGVYLNYLKFLHANPDNFTMVDKSTGKDGKHVFLVDKWHSTPVTVYRENGHLVTETVLYAKGTANALAIIKAEVTAEELKDVKLSPPPGAKVIGKVPQWQINLFQRPDLIKRMNQVAEMLK